MIMHAQQGRACITHKTLSCPDTVHMVLNARWLSRARPGQFVMLRVQPDTDPLLRRPISLCAILPDGIELLFKIRGSGTERMAAWPVGHQVDLIGPLGNGFDPPRLEQPACLVAGGIGIAPLIGLARWLLASRPGATVHMLLGARSATDIDTLAPFVPEECALQLATEDGSRGQMGLITEVLAAETTLQTNAALYGCGPMPMLNALAGLARRTGQPCHVSLEAHMACGVGACLGCNVPAHTQSGPASVRVCADGPIFDAKLIFP